MPQQIDPVTRLDRARVEGDRFVYEYTLSASSRLNPDAMKQQVRSGAVPAFCVGEMKGFRQLNATLVYRYRYPNGEPVYEVVIAERDCK